MFTTEHFPNLINSSLLGFSPIYMQNTDDFLHLIQTTLTYIFTMQSLK